MLSFSLQRLKNQTSRQVDLDFEALIQKFHKRHLQHVELVAKEEEEAEESGVEGGGLG